LRSWISCWRFAAITARYACAAVMATCWRVSSAEMRAVTTRSAAWFLLAQREAASSGYDSVALNAVCVRGRKTWSLKPRSSLRIVVPIAPESCGWNTVFAWASSASARRIAWAA
jgi:hypothetical protein